jgi:hypothetical protein
MCAAGVTATPSAAAAVDSRNSLRELSAMARGFYRGTVIRLKPGSTSVRGATCLHVESGFSRITTADRSDTPLAASQAPFAARALRSGGWPR